MTEPIHIEPAAGYRTAAQLHRQVFNAYTEAGFTQDQALELLKCVIEAGMKAGVIE